MEPDEVWMKSGKARSLSLSLSPASGFVRCQVLTLQHRSFEATRVVIFFFPYNPHLPIPTNPPQPSHPRGLDFGPFRLRLAPFGSVLGRFWVCFGSVSGVLGGVGVGSVRGTSVREKNITTLEPFSYHAVRKHCIVNLKKIYHWRPNYCMSYSEHIKSCTRTGLHYSNKFPHSAERKTVTVIEIWVVSKNEHHQSLHYSN